MKRLFPVIGLLSALIAAHCFAGSATWSSNPTSGDWNTAANWMPNTIPNSPLDVATFGASNLTALSITNTNIELDSAVFNSGAPPYTITVETSPLVSAILTLDGAGIINNSGVMQSFVIASGTVGPASISFVNAASAGELTTFSIATAGGFDFHDSASAGSATFNLTGGISGSGPTSMGFEDGTTAANATINATGGAYLLFYEASGGNATFNLTDGAYLQFAGLAGGGGSADHATVNCTGAYGVLFLENTSAGEGHFTITTTSSSVPYSNSCYFAETASAGNGTFVIGGAMGAAQSGGHMIFRETSSAANANITVMGGVDGGEGGTISFHNASDGGTCSINLEGNSTLKLINHKPPGVTIGSLSGSGSVFLENDILTIGSNNQSTTFSGRIHEGGGITKIGTGTLTLTNGGNNYTGGTTIRRGTLLVRNQSGSATGSGPVLVTSGALGGTGVITGNVIISTGGSRPAILSPGKKKSLGTLTIQSSLSFNFGAIYDFGLNSTRAAADQVVANGVNTDQGAAFAITDAGNSVLPLGTVFTAINNTAATPIGDTFGNLPDGGTITLGSNTFQANYEGGDGNDLTLTVVQ